MELIQYARQVQGKAYAPYSRFKVGAALEDTEGTVHVGCNIENSSYGLTICAERAALARAVADGKLKFQRMGLVADSESIVPCGACLQVLTEFAPDLHIICAGVNNVVKYKISDLLPRGFRLHETGGRR
ncbi:MAG: cytidine deaminase [Chitinophagales bacterium]